MNKESRSPTPKHAWVWEDFDASYVEPPPEAVRPPRERRVTLPTLLWGVCFAAAAIIAVLTVPEAGALAGHREALLLVAAFQVVAFAFLVLLTARHRAAVHSLAFFCRFIRPGLRRLLEQEGHIQVGNEKLFRGRKAVIMKIDMASYTRTTFQMPYGMRRLFQDLWFTLIDQVVADKVFLDKSLGDGSFYFFEDDLPGGSATVALRAALEIREQQVRLFDETYQQRLKELLASQPEIAGPAHVYLDRYEAKWGESFWERRTLVRIALVTGYVDEGLWGLASQSHYDVQGGPLVLAARMEPAARNGEIVFDRDFLAEIEEETPGLVDREQLEHRTIELKGIGEWEIFALAQETETPV